MAVTPVARTTTAEWMAALACAVAAEAGGGVVAGTTAMVSTATNIIGWACDLSCFPASTNAPSDRPQFGLFRNEAFTMPGKTTGQIANCV